MVKELNVDDTMYIPPVYLARQANIDKDDREGSLSADDENIESGAIEIKKNRVVIVEDDLDQTKRYSGNFEPLTPILKKSLNGLSPRLARELKKFNDSRDNFLETNSEEGDSNYYSSGEEKQKATSKILKDDPIKV